MAFYQIYSIMVTIIMLYSAVTMGSEMKVKVIRTQALGRPFGLGMLYDYRSDSLLPGITLWSKDKIAEDLTVDETKSINTKFEASDRLSEKAELLNIEANLKLSFMAGLVKVSGSAKYLHDRKKYSHEERITLSYHCTTKYEQLSMGTLAHKNIDYPKIFENHLATHVVTAIQYGGNSIFTFETLTSDRNSSDDVKGHLQALIKSIPTIEIEGDASVHLNNEQREFAKSVSIDFHGDIKPRYNPTTFVEAVKIYKELNELVGDVGEPLTVWLYPLEMLDSKAAKLEREISASLILEVEETIEHFHVLSIKCNDLENNVFFSKSSIFSDRLNIFRKIVHREKLNFQHKLIPVLFNVKAGFEEESGLNDILLDLIQSPFSYLNLNKWLSKCKYQLQQTNHLYEYMEGIEFLKFEPFNAQRLNPKFEHILGFLIRIPVVDEKMISSQNHSYLISSASDTFESARLFKDFFDANKINKEHNTAFFMSELPTTSQEITGSIYHYSSGRLISESFVPPSPPEKLRVVRVSTNSINLKWKPSTPGTEGKVRYEILYQVFPNGTIKIRETSSKNLVLPYLEPGTPYTIKCRGVAPSGVTKFTEISAPVVTLPKVSDESSSMMANSSGNMTDATTIVIGCPNGGYACYKLPGCPPGFFRLASTDQCFTVPDDTKRSWEDVKAKCFGLGLVMAKPYNAVALQYYLIERFGEEREPDGYWLGARGGLQSVFTSEVLALETFDFRAAYQVNEFRWSRDDIAIKSSSYLWSSQPTEEESSDNSCLMLRTMEDSVPFIALNCTELHLTICELIMN